MRRGALAAILSVAAAGCGPEPQAPAPPLDMMVETPGDWSGLAPAIGQRPGESLVLLRGPIVTDFDALLGPDAGMVRDRLSRSGGALRREGALLVSVTPPGAEAAYLVVDPAQYALEIGWATAGGWEVKRTAAAEIVRPAVVTALAGG